MLSQEDKIAIKLIRQEKGWGAKRLLKEFPEKHWSVSSLTRLIRKIDNKGSVKRTPGSGRPRAVRSQENIDLVQELICSQEGQPGTSKSPREIERTTGISRSSVRRIVKQDLHLNIFKRKKAHLLSDVDMAKRSRCCRTLLHRRGLKNVARIWFSDEKIFTVQPPINTQNDRVYSAAVKKNHVPSNHLIKGRKHFSQSVMVSVAITKSGKTNIHFIEKGTKVDGSYYRDTLLRRCLLPDIQRLSGDDYVFQQDGAPSHRARLTVEFLESNVPSFIEPALWPPNSPDLNPVDYAVWGALQQMVYRDRVNSLQDLMEKITRCWEELSQGLIDRAIDQWRPRLNAVVRVNGGHIEQTWIKIDW